MDALRGLALVGILAVNLEHFAGVGMYSTLHGAPPDYTLGRAVLAFFFSGKFYTIFAILFGLGLALQYQRLGEGPAALARLRRRLGWLLGLGALHGVFLFEGDILGTYALVGLFALRYLGREVQPGLVARFLMVGYALWWGFSTLLHEKIPLPGHLEVYLQGSFWEVSRVRLEHWLFNTPLASLLFGAELVGLFLLGFYLAPRWQTLGPRTLWGVVGLGLLVGLPVNLYNAAQPDLQDRQVEARVREQQQRGQRAELEIGQRDVAARELDTLEGGDQRRVAGIAAVDPHALVVAQQVRRGVGARAQTRSTRDGLDEGDGRTLAIGAAHRGDLSCRTRQRHARGDLAHAIQPHLDRAWVLALDVGQPLFECLRHARIVGRVSSRPTARGARPRRRRRCGARSR